MSIQRPQQRRGTVTVLTAFILVALVGMVAFAVDYGFLLKARVDLQRAADASALAATQDLIPDWDGSQDFDAVRARVREYCRKNLNDETFTIQDADIQVGRYDPDTIYSSVVLLDDGIYDTVRVTLRRNGSDNPKVPLFFGSIFGLENATIESSATAVLQKAHLLPPGADLLPFATPKSVWDTLQAGDMWTAYGDGKLVDEFGDQIPGNWGTLDVGQTNNGTSSLTDQIMHGLRASDINALYNDGRIQRDDYIDSSHSTWMNGDTGLSSGLKNAITEVHGEKRLIPIYESIGGAGQGEDVEFQIVRWGVVKLIDSQWRGEQHTYVRVQKSHLFSGELRAAGDLSVPAYIDGVFTSPVLVE